MDLSAQIDDAQRVLTSLADHRATLDEIAQATVRALRGGRKILACGNGGSAAQAQHLVTELVGRYQHDRQSLPAVYLGGDASMLTCIANDFAWEEVFSRPLGALAQPGDLLFCFSTSGASPNVVRALKVAKERRIESVALLGKGGGACAGLATWEVVVASSTTARIQECHLFLLHWLCEQIEVAFPA